MFSELGALQEGISGRRPSSVGMIREIQAWNGTPVRGMISRPEKTN